MAGGVLAQTYFKLSDITTHISGTPMLCIIFLHNMDIVGFGMKTFLSTAHSKLLLHVHRLHHCTFEECMASLSVNSLMPYSPVKTWLISLFTLSGPKSIVPHCKCLWSNHLSVLFFIRVTVITLKFCLEANHSWKCA